ncbi:MAG TPA: amidophosphoribosyltransferase [Thermodesulfovibrionia bacterium]|nr:amidophosphoribosyltransferase [Thermodesulfovibrionia bacterium]
MNDKFHEECGVFGILGHPDAANLVYLGLYALQHRGQESAGICSSDGDSLNLDKSKGLVADVFSPRKLKRLTGSMAIGHNRYSTAGSGAMKNAQPIMVNFALGSLAIAHNGNLVNANHIRHQLQERGSIFQSNADSEVIVHLIAHSKEPDLYGRIVDALNQVSGAYSLLLMTKNELIAVRDPLGFRPLCLGRFNDSYIVTSETCALDLIDAAYIRDIQPGEMLIINKNGLTSYMPFPKKRNHFCIFEFIYFARPDSNIFGNVNVSSVRLSLGTELAKKMPMDVDCVVPVPDSGVQAALGYSRESQVPFEFGLIRNHYVGRTFIEPKQSIRHFGVKLKLNPVQKLLKGKRIVVVDDSLVRGTTSKKIVSMLRELGGAREVHLRISSPPIIGPCYFGIDTPTKEELIAYNHNIETTRQYITADTLDYLSVNRLLKAVPNPDDFCTACFDNKYPLPVPSGIEKFAQMELF